MKSLKMLAIGLLALAFAAAPITQTYAQEKRVVNEKFITKYKKGKDGIIRTDVPKRPAGQQNALQMTAPALKTVRVGFVGLGMRGPGAVERFTHMKDMGLSVEIKALCDYEKGRAEGCQKFLQKAGMPDATIYYGEDGYKQLCEREDIDLVYIAVDWDHHVPVALYAMEHGKHAAVEVPTAMNLKDCWDLVNMSEKTRKHCIQLENCCYDFFEMNTLNMAQQGLFGEIVHVEGAYIHCLDDFWPYYWKGPKDTNGKDKDPLGWRMRYNRDYRGDVYATHGLGPACQLLNIHRGDRLKTLIAMDTDPFHGPEYIKSKTGEDVKDYQCGDHTTTLMKTEKGKVIEIQHNVMNPQPYSRLYQLTGMKGFANKYPEVAGAQYALGGDALASGDGVPNHENLNAHGWLTAEQQKALENRYMHPLIKEVGEKAKTVGGHGGMDFIMDYRLVYCLQHGLPLDMDVYDLAEWCCVAELGYISMKENAAVEVPDFTRGYWNVESKLKMHGVPGKE
ncbi:MAG: Gfo/Idh/MocA family oxidoreductase [Bacteroidaceae bacterium]|nr:Gfo/Idh/MocA family oxidoreductase [Bacteroidaceae bacterium]